MTLAGTVYAKGLGAHAASDIRYTMTACTTFTAKVGVDDEVGANGSVVFQVWGDGTKLYDSGAMTGASPTQPCPSTSPAGARSASSSTPTASPATTTPTGPTPG